MSAEDILRIRLPLIVLSLPYPKSQTIRPEGQDKIGGYPTYSNPFRDGESQN